MKKALYLFTMLMLSFSCGIAKADAPDCLIRFEIKSRNTSHVRFWTCDFTEKYIEINASYRT